MLSLCFRYDSLFHAMFYDLRKYRKLPINSYASKNKKKVDPDASPLPFSDPSENSKPKKCYNMAAEVISNTEIVPATKSL